MTLLFQGMASVKTLMALALGWASLPPPPLKVLQLLNSTAHIKRHLLNYRFRLYPTKERELALRTMHVPDVVQSWMGTITLL
jgi:hypothetical protein